MSPASSAEMRVASEVIVVWIHSVTLPSILPQ